MDVKVNDNSLSNYVVPSKYMELTIKPPDSEGAEGFGRDMPLELAKSSLDASYELSQASLIKDGMVASAAAAASTQGMVHATAAVLTSALPSAATPFSTFPRSATQSNAQLQRLDEDSDPDDDPFAHSVPHNPFQLTAQPPPVHPTANMPLQHQLRPYLSAGMPSNMVFSMAPSPVTGANLPVAAYGSASVLASRAESMALLTALRQTQMSTNQSVQLSALSAAAAMGPSIGTSMEEPSMRPVRVSTASTDYDPFANYVPEVTPSAGYARFDSEQDLLFALGYVASDPQTLVLPQLAEGPGENTKDVFAAAATTAEATEPQVIDAMAASNVAKTTDPGSSLSTSSSDDLAKVLERAIMDAVKARGNSCAAIQDLESSSVDAPSACPRARSAEGGVPEEEDAGNTQVASVVGLTAGNGNEVAVEIALPQQTDCPSPEEEEALVHAALLAVIAVVDAIVDEESFEQGEGAAEGGRETGEHDGPGDMGSREERVETEEHVNFESEGAAVYQQRAPADQSEPVETAEETGATESSVAADGPLGKSLDIVAASTRAGRGPSSSSGLTRTPSHTEGHRRGSSTCSSSIRGSKPSVDQVDIASAALVGSACTAAKLLRRCVSGNALPEQDDQAPEAQKIGPEGTTATGLCAGPGEAEQSEEAVGDEGKKSGAVDEASRGPRSSQASGRDSGCGRLTVPLTPPSDSPVSDLKPAQSEDRTSERQSQRPSLSASHSSARVPTPPQSAGSARRRPRGAESRPLSALAALSSETNKRHVDELQIKSGSEGPQLDGLATTDSSAAEGSSSWPASRGKAGIAPRRVQNQDGKNKPGDDGRTTWLACPESWLNHLSTPASGPGAPGLSNVGVYSGADGGVQITSGSGSRLARPRIATDSSYNGSVASQESCHRSREVSPPNRRYANGLPLRHLNQMMPGMPLLDDLLGRYPVRQAAACSPSIALVSGQLFVSDRLQKAIGPTTVADKAVLYNHSMANAADLRPSFELSSPGARRMSTKDWALPRGSNRPTFFLNSYLESRMAEKAQRAWLAGIYGATAEVGGDAGGDKKFVSDARRQPPEELLSGLRAPGSGAGPSHALTPPAPDGPVGAAVGARRLSAAGAVPRSYAHGDDVGDEHGNRVDRRINVERWLRSACADTPQDLWRPSQPGFAQRAGVFQVPTQAWSPPGGGEMGSAPARVRRGRSAFRPRPSLQPQASAWAAARDGNGTRAGSPVKRKSVPGRRASIII